jgi:hypothetical protein
MDALVKGLASSPTVGDSEMSLEIASLVLSAFGAVCLAGCVYVGLGWLI